jgi:hypothetical protein
MMRLRKKLDGNGMGDCIGLLLTKMIIDFTGEQWVDNYRASIHCLIQKLVEVWQNAKQAQRTRVQKELVENLYANYCSQPEDGVY